MRVAFDEYSCSCNCGAKLKPGFSTNWAGVSFKVTPTETRTAIIILSKEDVLSLSKELAEAAALMPD